MRKALATSPAWDVFTELNPDIALPQDIGGIPDEIQRDYSVLSRFHTTKKGNPQKQSTAVLTKGRIIREIPLVSPYAWVNKELEFLKGNFISCLIELETHQLINVVSVYSPAWPIPRERL